MNTLPHHFNHEKPIFMQIAEMLENAILSGAYAEETQIPSITEFSVAYKINPATALKGVNVLVDSGLLYKKRGTGMFVSRGAKDKLAQKRKDDFFSNFIRPLILESRNLKIEREELFNMLERGQEEYGD